MNRERTAHIRPVLTTNSAAMAVRGFFLQLRQSTRKEYCSLPARSFGTSFRRGLSVDSEVAEPLEDVDPSSSLSSPGPTEDIIESFNPVQRSRKRHKELPPSRCVNH